MGTTYETDVIAWANEQAALLRSGQLSAIDIEHIAEEILDVGKSEQRELESRMAVLLAHLLKWKFQPERQSGSWKRTIKEQRKSINLRVRKTPSLKYDLSDEDWLLATWADAVAIAVNETGMGNFPETNPWTIEDILSEGWLPE
jgi:Domain of unknown function DUF29